jgi:hypothetical protein
MVTLEGSCSDECSGDHPTFPTRYRPRRGRRTGMPVFDGHLTWKRKEAEIRTHREKIDEDTVITIQVEWACAAITGGKAGGSGEGRRGKSKSDNDRGEHG